MTKVEGSEVGEWWDHAKCLGDFTLTPRSRRDPLQFEVGQPKPGVHGNAYILILEI